VGGVFVNYRTGDGDWAARLIEQELAARFGSDWVFYASRSIRPGDDFTQEIEKRLAESAVLLAVIGRQWLSAADDAGNRRLDSSGDWVRREIRTAAAHQVRVIPVLLDGVARPEERDLPDDISVVARSQYLRLHHREAHGVQALVDEITRLLPSGAGEPWRVRIRDARGAVLGAGVLLAGEHVLTCAHVTLDAGPEVTVDFVGLSGVPSIKARTVPGCVRPQDGRRGDVALLRLAWRPATGVGATLRRVALSWDRAVHMCGFPPGLKAGIYTRATLTGYGSLGGEWLQMNARSPVEQRVGAGFSGAGVVDDRTGDVLGIVVGEYPGQAANLSWMIPVETILSHLPQVVRWVTGDAAADEVFSKSTDPGADHGELVRTFTEWLARRDTGDCLIIIVGSELAVMYRAVALSSREQPTTVTDPPEGTVPALGSIDLALDASGKTTEEVSRRILNRAGVPVNQTFSASQQVRAGVPPMTIVVDGVDNAEQPENLLNEVLKPLAEGGSRLALGFRDEFAPSLRIARSWDIGSGAYRLARLAEQIDELDGVEQRLMLLRTHITDQAPTGNRGPELRMALSVLRADAAGSGPDSVRLLLERCEQQAARALRRATKAVERLAGWLAERDSLRGRLGAYQAKANDAGLAEDVRLAAAYRRAHDLLYRSPTDIPAARAAVQDYMLAVRQAIRGRLGEGER
jgi:serine protease Do